MKKLPVNQIRLLSNEVAPVRRLSADLQTLSESQFVNMDSVESLLHDLALVEHILLDKVEYLRRADDLDQESDDIDRDVRHIAKMS